jgi:serine/threonine protein kinase
MDKYKIERTLGEGINAHSTFCIGSYGKVQLAIDKTTQRRYAIKIIGKKGITEPKQKEHIISECTILANISFPFIVIDCCVDNMF